MDILIITPSLLTALHNKSLPQFIECMNMDDSLYARIDVQDERGKTLLRHAVDHRALDIVHHLLERGANPNIPDNRDITPLLSISFHQNTHSDEVNCAVIRELIVGGADVYYDSGKGHTFLYYSIRHNKRSHIELLVECGIPLTINSVVLLPLHTAAIHGSLEVAKYLIEQGAKVDKRDCFKSTLLHYAVKYPEIVKLLLLHGADVNARDMFENTPLHCAVRVNNIESVIILLDHGADVTFKCRYSGTDDDLLTASDVARQMKFTDIKNAIEAHESTLDIKTPESFMEECAQ